MTNSQLPSHLTVWRKAESFSPKPRNNTRVPTFHISTQHSTGCTSRTIKKKEIKGIQIGKAKVKFTFCKWYDHI